MATNSIRKKDGRFSFKSKATRRAIRDCRGRKQVTRGWIPRLRLKDVHG